MTNNEHNIMPPDSLGGKIRVLFKSEALKKYIAERGECVTIKHNCDDGIITNRNIQFVDLERLEESDDFVAIDEEFIITEVIGGRYFVCPVLNVQTMSKEEHSEIISTTIEDANSGISVHNLPKAESSQYGTYIYTAEDAVDFVLLW